MPFFTVWSYSPLVFEVQRLPPGVSVESVLSSFDRATSAAEGSVRVDDIFSPPPPIPHLPGPLDGDAHRRISQVMKMISWSIKLCNQKIALTR